MKFSYTQLEAYAEAHPNDRLLLEESSEVANADQEATVVSIERHSLSEKEAIFDDKEASRVEIQNWLDEQ